MVGLRGVESRARSLPSVISAIAFASAAAILDDPMECSRGERLSITLAKNRINRAPERVGKAKVEVDIFELLRDSEYETAETSKYPSMELILPQFCFLLAHRRCLARCAEDKCVIVKGGTEGKKHLCAPL